MQGLVFIKCNTDGSFKSSADKFFDEKKLEAIAQACGAGAGDLILLLAGKEEKTRKAAGELRIEMAKRLDLRNKDSFRLLWVIDFPLFEYDENTNRWVARHHPFTAPKKEQIETMLNNDPSIKMRTIIWNIRMLVLKRMHMIWF